MSLLLKLLALFVLVPAAEIFLLGRLSAHPRIGFSGVLLLILVTGVVGAAVARWQGLRAFRRVRDDLERGQLPAQSLLEGVAVLLGCALLVTPGVITDAVGFLLFIPPARRLIARLVKRWIKKKLDRAIQTGHVHFHSQSFDDLDMR